jgi:hypothetical protein
LHDEQTVNGSRKIAWASVVRFKRQYINININISITININTQ